MTTKTYVTYLLPGFFMPEEETRKMPDGVDVDAALAKMPKNCYAFHFWTRTEVETVDGEKLRGEKKRVGGIYYPGAEKIHWTDIPKTPKNEILISNCKTNGLDGFGIKCRVGNWQWLQEGDVILPMPGEKVDK